MDKFQDPNSSAVRNLYLVPDAPPPPNLFQTGGGEISGPEYSSTPVFRRCIDHRVYFFGSTFSSRYFTRGSSTEFQQRSRRPHWGTCRTRGACLQSPSSRRCSSATSAFACRSYCAAHSWRSSIPLLCASAQPASGLLAAESANTGLRVIPQILPVQARFDSSGSLHSGRGAQRPQVGL